MNLTKYDTIFGLQYIGMPLEERLVKNKFYSKTPFFIKSEFNKKGNYFSKTIPRNRTSKIFPAGLEMRIKNRERKRIQKEMNQINELKINRALKRKFSK